MNGEKFNLTRVLQIGTSKGVIIPVVILNALAWEKGDTIFMQLNEVGELFLTKIEKKQLTKVIDY